MVNYSEVLAKMDYRQLEPCRVLSQRIILSRWLFRCCDGAFQVMLDYVRVVAGS